MMVLLHDRIILLHNKKIKNNMFTIPQVVSSVAQDHIDLDTHGKLPGKPFLSEPAMVRK